MIVRIACAAIVLATNIAAAAASDELVDVRSVDPTILVELRYATERNITGRAIYPPGTRPLVRRAVAHRLAIAQEFLRARGYGLKIWDAYRPPSAQRALWQLTRNRSYVADPSGELGSLHTWGVAVDATLVDSTGREMQMPTGFDEFTPAAMLRYRGDDKLVRWNLKVLQSAMHRGGFYGMRTEWWHFIAYGWKKYGRVSEDAGY